MGECGRQGWRTGKVSTKKEMGVKPSTTGNGRKIRGMAKVSKLIRMVKSTTECGRQDIRTGKGSTLRGMKVNPTTKGKGRKVTRMASATWPTRMATRTTENGSVLTVQPTAQCTRTTKGTDAVSKPRPMRP